MQNLIEYYYQYEYDCQTFQLQLIEEIIDMPTPLKDWEINNIGYFIREFLRIKFRDATLEIISPLDERDEQQHCMTVQTTKLLLFKKTDTTHGKCVRKLHLNDLRTIDIQISKSRADANVYKIYLQSQDLVLIRYFINQKIIKQLNQYFIGEAVQQWQVHEEFIEAKAPIHKKLANTPELRLFQMPKLKDKPGMLDTLLKTFAIILKAIANFTVPSNGVVPKNLPSIFHGTISHSHIKNQGKYLFMTGYSMELLCHYHNKRNEYLRSVAYWIQNAFINSSYSFTQFNIVHQLELSSPHKYTMVVSIKNDVELPKYLSIVLDNWQIIFKSRSLGSINNLSHYKLTLSTTAVMFLNNYYFKRIVDALNDFSGFKINNTNSWIMYAAEDDDHCSKACITLFTESGVSKTLKQEHLNILWKKFTGREDYLFKLTDQSTPKSNKCTVIGAIDGDIEPIINDSEQIVIGFLYSTSSLDKILKYLQRNDLHLTPTPATQLDSTDTYQYVHARLFNGTSLVNSLQKTVTEPIAPIQKQAKFAEQATQSPLASCIFDEGLNQINPNDLNNFFPKKELAKNIQFYKKQSYREIAAQIVETPKSPSFHAQPLSPPRTLSQHDSLPSATPSRKRSYQQQDPYKRIEGAQPLSADLANDSQPLLLEYDDKLPPLSVDQAVNVSPVILNDTDDLLPPPMPTIHNAPELQSSVKPAQVSRPLANEPEEQQVEEPIMGAQPLSFGSY